MNVTTTLRIIVCAILLYLIALPELASAQSPPPELREQAIAAANGEEEAPWGMIMYLRSQGMDMAGNVISTGDTRCTTCRFFNTLIDAFITVFDKVSDFSILAFELHYAPLAAIGLTLIGIRMMFFTITGDTFQSVQNSLAKYMALIFLSFTFVVNGGQLNGVKFENTYELLGLIPVQIATDASIGLRLSVSEDIQSSAMLAGSQGCSYETDENSRIETAKAAIGSQVCQIERAYSLGFAMVFTFMNAGSDTIGARIFRFITAFFLLIWLGLSFFKVLGIVFGRIIRSLFAAAASPIFFLCLFFKATQNTAFLGFRALIAGPVSMLIVGVMSLFVFQIFSGIINFYNRTYESTIAYIKRPLSEIPDGTSHQQFLNFLQRMNLEKTDPNYIPMDLSSPWILYLIIACAVVGALMNKIVEVTDDIFGSQAPMQMANAFSTGLRTAGTQFVGAAVGGVAATAYTLKSGTFMTVKAATNTYKAGALVNELGVAGTTGLLQDQAQQAAARAMSRVRQPFGTPPVQPFGDPKVAPAHTANPMAHIQAQGLKNGNSFGLHTALKKAGLR